ncbi:PAIRED IMMUNOGLOBULIN-LIKE TYPE 2 RECEPTOR [Ceraceosorus bombacis]|uniref:PAIRED IMMUNOGLOBULIN-LIKE TYPE 2 RECEPTOR n=1 Tax=Ceraceosorus bombacis TaxID=401625 RepID=A0A0P1BEH1_9BASI|nr:PAIRED IMMUNOGLOBULIN-LIKE TYPE 2 RECEPTOR [Ceraceosorus bombacis]
MPPPVLYSINRLLLLQSALPAQLSTQAANAAVEGARGQEQQSLPPWLTWSPIEQAPGVFISTPVLDSAALRSVLPTQSYCGPPYVPLGAGWVDCSGHTITAAYTLPTGPSSQAPRPTATAAPSMSSWSAGSSGGISSGGPYSFSHSNGYSDVYGSSDYGDPFSNSVSPYSQPFGSGGSTFTEILSDQPQTSDATPTFSTSDTDFTNLPTSISSVEPSLSTGSSSSGDAPQTATTAIPTLTHTPLPSQHGSSSTALPTGAIVGIAVGGAVAASVLALLAFLFCRRRRQRDAQPTDPAGILAQGPGGGSTGSRRRLKRSKAPSALDIFNANVAAGHGDGGMAFQERPLSPTQMRGSDMAVPAYLPPRSGQLYVVNGGSRPTSMPDDEEVLRDAQPHAFAGLAGVGAAGVDKGSLPNPHPSYSQGTGSTMRPAAPPGRSTFPMVPYPEPLSADSIYTDYGNVPLTPPVATTRSTAPLNIQAGITPNGRRALPATPQSARRPLPPTPTPAGWTMSASPSPSSAHTFAAATLLPRTPPAALDRASIASTVVMPADLGSRPTSPSSPRTRAVAAALRARLPRLRTTFGEDGQAAGEVVGDAHAHAHLGAGEDQIWPLPRSRQGTGSSGDNSGTVSGSGRGTASGNGSGSGSGSGLRGAREGSGGTNRGAEHEGTGLPSQSRFSMTPPSTSHRDAFAAGRTEPDDDGRRGGPNSGLTASSSSSKTTLHSWRSSRGTRGTDRGHDASNNSDPSARARRGHDRSDSLRSGTSMSTSTSSNGNSDVSLRASVIRAYTWLTREEENDLLPSAAQRPDSMLDSQTSSRPAGLPSYYQRG